MNTLSYNKNNNISNKNYNIFYRNTLSYNKSNNIYNTNNNIFDTNTVARARRRGDRPPSNV